MIHIKKLAQHSTSTQEVTFSGNLVLTKFDPFHCRKCSESYSFLLVLDVLTLYLVYGRVFPLRVIREGPRKVFPGGSVVKNPLVNVGNPGSIPGSGRLPRVGKSPCILAWKPWTEQPGGLQPMGLQRVRHNLVTKTKTARPSLRTKAVLLKSPGNVQNADQAKSSSMNADQRNGQYNISQ